MHFTPRDNVTLAYYYSLGILLLFLLDGFRMHTGTL